MSKELVEMDDCISREKTLDKFCDYVAGGMSMNDFDALYEIVAKMEPVIPIPDNATNGDMIKAIYGIEPIYGDQYFIFYGGEMRFSREWWNAPYKGGE